MQPKLFGDTITNTPPLYVWFLAAWGRVFGWSEWVLRLPSTLAWASTAYPVGKLGGSWAGLLWLSFPLSFIVAGKTQPDAILSGIMAWTFYAASQKRLDGFLGGLMAGVLVKPHAAMMGLAAAGWRQGLVYGAGLGVSLAWVLWKTGFGGMILNHVTGRGLGHWALAWFLIVCLGLGSITGLRAVFVARREDYRLWLVLGAMVAFTLFAMPPRWHEYYWVPALPFLAILAWRSPGKAMPWLLAVNLALAGWGSMDNGDLWDHRIKDLTGAHEIDSVGPGGLGTVASWYEGHRVPPGLNGTTLSRVEVPGCLTLESKPPTVKGDGWLYVLSCEAKP